MGGPPLALLNYNSWKRRFGVDPGVLGRTVTLNTHPLTIVGVAEARLRPGVPARQAQAEIEVLASALWEKTGGIMLTPGGVSPIKQKSLELFKRNHNILRHKRGHFSDSSVGVTRARWRRESRPCGSTQPLTGPVPTRSLFE